LSPVARLPAELLSEIFLWLLDYVFAKTEWPRIGNINRRLERTIGLVCKTWRRVALTTPRLWRYLVVPMNPAKLGGFLEQFLPRIRMWPFHFQILPGYTGALPLLVDALRPQASQWSTIIWGGDINDFKQLKPVATPGLKEAHLTFEGFGPELLPTQFLDFAPSLQHLDINASRFTFNEGAIDASLPPTAPLQVLVMNTGKLRMPSLFASLQQYSTTLQVLELRVEVFDDALDSWTDPVPLHSLRRLVLVEKAAHFLHFIDAPNVQEMQFEDCHTVSAHAELANYLVRVPSAVSHMLRLKVQPYMEDKHRNLLWCLRQLGNLTWLDLTATLFRPSGLNDLLQRLRYTDGAVPVLPSLTTAHIAVASRKAFEVFASSRSEARSLDGMTVPKVDAYLRCSTTI
ncbi:hypothetical protein FB107DRAFT_208451, partial [Schizophyllum commune]